MNVSQTQFHDALLDPGQTVPDGLSDAIRRPAGRRFNVYRNNVAVSLTEAMRTAFPIITKLLGQQNMDGLAGMYLRNHPPSSPLMMFYGENFPEFLSSLPQLNHLGYLPDVARLELALRRSYHAADAQAMTGDELSAIPPDVLLRQRLELAPSVKIIQSEWPVYDIWRFNTQENAPKPQAGAQDLIVLRPEFDPEPHLLTPGGAALITTLDLGEPFEVANEAALTAEPEFNLGATLALLLQGGALTSLKKG